MEISLEVEKGKIHIAQFLSNYYGKGTTWKLWWIYKIFNPWVGEGCVQQNINVAE